MRVNNYCIFATNNVKKKRIVNAFKKCSISNAMNRSEDVIYENVDEIIEYLDDQHDDCLDEEEFKALCNDTDTESDFDGF